MESLSALDLVEFWDWGREKHPVDRAMGLLALAYPELSFEEIAALTVGQRNHRLLRLRRQMLGADMAGYAQCPECGEKLEFSVNVQDILLPEPAQTEYRLSAEGYELTYRLPAIQDLATIIGLSDIEAARWLLVTSCVIQASRDGETVEIESLPDSVIPALSADVLANDPQAEMYFEMACAACGHNWSVLFDIVSFFWTELADRAHRILQDVHTLARAYGWRERDILSMSTKRRQIYLEMVQ